MFRKKKKSVFINTFVFHLHIIFIFLNDCFKRCFKGCSLFLYKSSSFWSQNQRRNYSTSLWLLLIHWIYSQRIISMKRQIELCCWFYICLFYFLDVAVLPCFVNFLCYVNGKLEKILFFLFVRYVVSYILYILGFNQA